MSDQKPVRSFYDVPGWFRWLDKTVFDTLLRAQESQPPGDIVELGVYLGKSAVVLGDHLRRDERLVVVDLFGTDPGDDEGVSPEHEANRRENAMSYGSLERSAFEANYLALHPELPVVITGTSASIVDHVAPRSARFVHVDAGHLYENVREDVENTRGLLRPAGIAVFDDYRSEHTPGVAAAVWEAVANEGLRPFALSPNKLYGTYDDPTPYVDVLRTLFETDDRYHFDEQDVLGHRVLRVNPGRKPAPAGGVTLAELRTVADSIVDRLAQPSRPDEAAAAAPGRGLVRDLLPPALARAIGRVRSRPGVGSDPDRTAGDR